ncbi:MAG TPA: beta-glucosidase BglX [Opitutaceae bacterium]|nr:beta-glucosidase BglX [Opitutaceae bacterium]
MRPTVFRVLVLGSSLVSSIVAAPAPLVDHATNERIETLLAQMTLEEKVGQLHQLSSFFDPTGPVLEASDEAALFTKIRDGRIGSMLNVRGAEAVRRLQQLAVECSRLHIPLLFGYDVVHGYRTIFPVPLGETASWNPAAAARSARIAATEASAAGIDWTFAPMVDIARDARWGRIMEGAGEDPFLGAAFAAARVRGFQGSDLRAVDSVAACVKHFAAYGFAEAGRDYNTVDLSPATLHDVVLPPFRAAIEAGAATVMTSFNEIAGLPSVSNTRLQRDVLKGEWQFPGLVVSDWGAIRETIAHGFAADLRHAAALAILAGNDMDMESSAYDRHLAGLVGDGTVPPAVLNDAVRRVLRVKFALGLFDDPYRRCDAAREKRLLEAPEHLAAAREIAGESIVLLKNSAALLPLDPKVRRIAVIGALAADKDAPLGNWRGEARRNSAVSLLEGIRAAVGPRTVVDYAEGLKLTIGDRFASKDSVYNTTDRSKFPAAVAAARQADVVVLALGEDAWQTGEGRSQADISLKGLQQELFATVAAANPRIVVVLMAGRPLVLGPVAEQAPAILEAWHLGSQAGHAIADVLFGLRNPSGKLPVSFPRTVGQCPLYYAHKNTGRPTSDDGRVFWSHYTDTPNNPLYPFGFGLSYTTFTLSTPRVSATAIGPRDTLHITATVTNTGPRAGAEVVQLYVRDVVGSLTRPVKELKGFAKIDLRPGETREVAFTLTAADLAFTTARGTWEAEPGEFQIFVGNSSAADTPVSFLLRPE